MDILWLERVRLELMQLRRYIAADNPAAAQATGQRLIAAVEALRDMPGMGRPGRLSGTRELVVAGTPFIILYRQRDGKIEILRVMHGARKWPEDLS